MITPTEALKAAKDLAGNFANLRPDNPARFLEGLADILVQYPVGLVRECVNSRVGIASKVEFLSQKTLITWLDERLTFYQSLASYTARERKPEPKFTDDHRGTMLLAMNGLQKAMKDGTAAGMTFEQFIELGQGQRPVQQAAE